MELFGSFTSPFVRHCRIALLEEQFEFEFVETDGEASAAQSPTKRVPFLKDGDIQLTDSSSILKHVREKAGEPFLQDLQDYERYCLANTVLDSCVNLFLLERHGLSADANPYLQRQSQRIESGLSELNQHLFSEQAPYSDSELRLACFLDWGLFRERIQLEEHSQLASFLEQLNQYPPFAKTSPPR